MSAQRSANTGVFARPALASPHIVVCTETDSDWHGSIYLFSNHFLLEILSSVRSLTWRPEVSGFWVFELLFIVWEGKLRQSLPYFISLERLSFTAMRQYRPVSTALSVRSTGLRWCLQFSNTNSANKYWASKYWMYYKWKRERGCFLFIVCFYLRIWGNFSISLKLELWWIGERVFQQWIQ